MWLIKITINYFVFTNFRYTWSHSIFYHQTSTQPNSWYFFSIGVLWGRFFILSYTASTCLWLNCKQYMGCLVIPIPVGAFVVIQSYPKYHVTCDSTVSIQPPCLCISHQRYWYPENKYIYIYISFAWSITMWPLNYRIL